MEILPQGEDWEFFLERFAPFSKKEPCGKLFLEKYILIPRSKPKRV
jgi:hypothetical protein